MKSGFELLLCAMQITVCACIQKLIKFSLLMNNPSYSISITSTLHLITIGYVQMLVSEMLQFNSEFMNYFLLMGLKLTKSINKKKLRPYIK